MIILVVPLIVAAILYPILRYVEKSTLRSIARDRLTPTAEKK